LLGHERDSKFLAKNYLDTVDNYDGVLGLLMNAP
jgi:hypothetical protein